MCAIGQYLSQRLRILVVYRNSIGRLLYDESINLRCEILLDEEWQVDGGEWRDHILMTIAFSHKFVMLFGKFRLWL